jgi:glycosyltransferase involved in cell wall biosynthesis
MSGFNDHMSYLSLNEDNVIKAKSDHLIKMNNSRTITSMADLKVGRRIPKEQKLAKDMKVAFVCNWNAQCGISTYSKFLIEAIKPFFKEIKIFSEIIPQKTLLSDDNVDYCWVRGESLITLAKKLNEYEPDFINIQHEYGIFPNACHFLKLLENIYYIPYAITLHSVYEHQDKTIFTAPIKSIIVHSQEAMNILKKLGHTNPIYSIPHGCFDFNNGELWNSFRNPYAIVQFGFGFRYKGVERAIEAISILKKKKEKFKDIFYLYLCSESEFTSSIHDEYINDLQETIQSLNLESNVSIIRGYQSEQTINNYIRTAKMSIFPYKVDPDNTVYGASGAIRIAMANKVPIVASESHLFDDLEGVIPRPSNAEELADQIDKIFSDWKYKDKLLEKIRSHVQKNSWHNSAKMYAETFEKIRSSF